MRRPGRWVPLASKALSICDAVSAHTKGQMFTIHERPEVYRAPINCSQGGILKLGVSCLEWPEQLKPGEHSHHAAAYYKGLSEGRARNLVANKHRAAPHCTSALLHRALPTLRTQTVTALNWTPPTAVTPCGPQPPSLHESYS